MLNYENVTQGKLLLEGTIGDMKREFGGSRYQVVLKRKTWVASRAQTSEADPLYRQMMRISPGAERVTSRDADEDERYFVPSTTTSAEGESGGGGDPIVEIAALLEDESGSLGVERWAVECTSLQQIFMALVSEANGDEVANGIGSRRLRGIVGSPPPTPPLPSRGGHEEEESRSNGDGGEGADSGIIATASSSSSSSSSRASSEPDPSVKSCSPPSLDTYSESEVEAETCSPPLLEKRALWRSQLKGLWYKQFKHYTRDWRFLVSSFVIPPVLITATMLLALLRPPSERPPLLLTPSLYGPNSNSFVRYISICALEFTRIMLYRRIIQGDTSRCSLGSVDMKTKVMF